MKDQPRSEQDVKKPTEGRETTSHSLREIKTAHPRPDQEKFMPLQGALQPAKDWLSRNTSRKDFQSLNPELGPKYDQLSELVQQYQFSTPEQMLNTIRNEQIKQEFINVCSKHKEQINKLLGELKATYASYENSDELESHEYYIKQGKDNIIGIRSSKKEISALYNKDNFDRRYDTKVEGPISDGHYEVEVNVKRDKKKIHLDIDFRNGLIKIEGASSRDKSSESDVLLSDENVELEGTKPFPYQLLVDNCIRKVKEAFNEKDFELQGLRLNDVLDKRFRDMMIQGIGSSYDVDSYREKVGSQNIANIHIKRGSLSYYAIMGSPIGTYHERVGRQFNKEVSAIIVEDIAGEGNQPDQYNVIFAYEAY